MDASKQMPAFVSNLPVYSGDGYGYGGGTLLTIGTTTVPFGEGRKVNEIAYEMALRWNTHGQILDALKTARRSMHDWDDTDFVAHVDALIAKSESVL